MPGRAERVRALRVLAALTLVLALLWAACGVTETDVQPTPTTPPQPTPTAEPRPEATPEPTPVDALEARRWDAALRVCDALENTLLVSEPAFFLGALQFARDEGMPRSELSEAMQRECPGAFRALRYEPDLMAEFEKLP